MTSSFLNNVEGVSLGAPTSELLSRYELVVKGVPIRLCEYNILNSQEEMINTETEAASSKGLLFNTPQFFSPGVLLRVWVEIPDYWLLKSKYVNYRHTQAPTYFQVLSQVVNCYELSSRKGEYYQLVCENVNFDPVDEQVFCEYLGIRDSSL